MSKLSAPCYNEKTHSDCQRRTPGCHQHCKAWKDYEVKRNANYRDEDPSVAYCAKRARERKAAYLRKVQGRRNRGKYGPGEE